MDYWNGKIYKVINDITNDVYIGGTTLELKDAMDYHIAQAIESPNLMLSRLINEHGESNFGIVLIKDWQCYNKMQLTDEIKRCQEIYNSIDYCAFVEQRANCACGGRYFKKAITYHMKTAKHTNWLQKKS